MSRTLRASAAAAAVLLLGASQALCVSLYGHLKLPQRDEGGLMLGVDIKPGTGGRVETLVIAFESEDGSRSGRFEVGSPETTPIGVYIARLPVGKYRVKQVAAWTPGGAGKGAGGSDFSEKKLAKLAPGLLNVFEVKEGGLFFLGKLFLDNGDWESLRFESGAETEQGLCKTFMAWSPQEDADEYKKWRAYWTPMLDEPCGAKAAQARPAAAPSAAPAPASAPRADEVSRDPIDLVVQVKGTVTPIDIFRLKSTIEGRSEKVWTTTGVWVNEEQALGVLVNKEYSALMDARSTTDKSVLEDRWQTVYQPTRIHCPYACYILKAYARPKTLIQPRAVLFEAAGHLRMEARVPPDGAHLVRDGMTLQYWAKGAPQRRFSAKVSHYVLDVQGENVRPGGSFNLDTVMGPEHFFPPGTQWEGIIVPAKKDNVLKVPTEALVRFGGDVYLPVKVTVGITTPDWTEITSGVEQRRRILKLSDEQLGQARRHSLEEAPAAPASARPGVRSSGGEETGPIEAPRPQPRRVEEVRDPDSNLGEDPYAE